MKIRHSKQKGLRLLKSTHKTRPLWIEPIEFGYWFDIVTGQWAKEYPIDHSCTSSYYSMKYPGYNNVWSLKAAKRKIANWDVPKGTWFHVFLPWVGYSFKIRK